MGSCMSAIKKTDAADKRRSEATELVEKRGSKHDEQKIVEPSEDVQKCENGEKVGTSNDDEEEEEDEEEENEKEDEKEEEEKKSEEQKKSEEVEELPVVKDELDISQISKEEEEEEEKKKKKKIIILNGAPGSGKDTQCNLVVAKYNFHLIIISELLKNYVKKYKRSKSKEEKEKEKREAVVVGGADNDDENIETNVTERTIEEEQNLQIIEKCFIDGSLVPDDTVITLFTNELTKLLNEEESNVKGIIINGYPRTEKQAFLFKEKNIKVDALINITVTKEILWSRIKERLVDPLTNKTYTTHLIDLIKKEKNGEELNEEEKKILSEHDNLNEIKEEDVLNRLKKRDDDDEDVFNKRYDSYKENEEKIVPLFQNVYKEINGENSKEQVFNDISVIIDGL